MVLGVLNVFFRDVGQFFNIVLQFWFWFTPVVYPVTALPAEIRKWLVLNPMAAVVQAYQGILLNGQRPAWSSLLPVTVLAILFCALGMHLFRKRAGEMVDEL
jgi:lipopolysaccharide transport system permease protein